MFPLIDPRSEDEVYQLLRMSRNAALFRIGDFAMAAKTIAENEVVDAGGRFNAINWLLMAMTQHHLGNSKEESRWLDRAKGRIREIRKDYLPILYNSTFWPGNLRLYLELLEGEATALIQPDADSADGESK